MYARPQILWGTNFENILEIGYFDHRVTSRRPWKNAERTQRGGGVEDSWMTGWDYELHGDVRWIPDVDITNPYICSGWSGGLGFQAFFDWARQANTFRYVPDRNFPSVFVDSCYLSEPWDDNGGDLESNGTRRVGIVIRNQLVDFAMVERGLIFDFGPGQTYSDPATSGLFVFSRSTAFATQVESDGAVAELQANQIRDRHHLAGFAIGAKVIQFDGVRTNKIENGDYEQDSVGSLGNVSTIVRDSTNKKHKSWALKVTTTNVAGSGNYWKTRAGANITAVAGRTYSLSCWIYAPAASVGKTFNLNMEWYDSVPTLISNSASGTLTLVAGWQWFTFTATAPANTAFCVPTFYTTGAIGVFDYWVDLAQFEEGAFASSAIPTNTGTATRNEDRLTVQLPVKLPMHIDFTVMYHFQARHTNVASWDDTQPQLDCPLFQLSKQSAVANDALEVRAHRQNGATSYEFEYGNNLNTASRTFTLGTAPQKLVCRHRASDHVLSCSVDNSAFVSGSAPAAAAYQDLQYLTFFNTGFAGIGSFTGLIRIKIAPGLKTQAEMEAM